MSAAIHRCAWRDADDAVATAACEGATWLRAVRRLRATEGGEPLQIRTDEDCEHGVVVLSGTHDLEANSGSWVSRGVRKAPFAGRPVALFMPPGTRFRCSGGAGDLLLVSTVKPEPPVPDEPEPEPAAKPLLPLAGSNKAFDSKSGTWQPIESFPDSAEAILPRRIEQQDLDGVRVERVFPRDYKAFGLTVYEAVLAQGQALALPGPDAGDGFPTEWASFVRTEGTARLADETVDATADTVLWSAGEGSLEAVDGATYALVVGAGPKIT